jgi:hypothetical protein
MRTERLIAAAAFVVTAFVAIPAAQAITQNAAAETRSSIKDCHYYYYGGRHWRYRWHGGYYNYYWRHRYYHARYHCHRYGWCYR